LEPAVERDQFAQIEVQVLLERMESNIEISVIDTGIGIDPEFLKRVFDTSAKPITQRRGSTVASDLGLPS
jgi:signal transduction histidine kinase